MQPDTNKIDDAVLALLYLGLMTECARGRDSTGKPWIDYTNKGSSPIHGGKRNRWSSRREGLSGQNNFSKTFSARIRPVRPKVSRGDGDLEATPGIALSGNRIRGRHRTWPFQ